MTEAERVLIECALNGATPPPGTGELACIRASVITDLLKGTYGPVGSGGVRVERAQITGPLRLAKLALTVGLRLEGCRLDAVVEAWDTRMPWLDLIDCRLPALHGDRIKVSGSLRLQEVHTTTDSVMGSVRLPEAHIDGDLVLDSTRLHNTGSGPGLHAIGIRVGGALSFRDGNVSSRCNTAAIRLVNGEVAGDVRLDGTKLRNIGGPALNAEGVRVGGSLVLASGFEARARSGDLAAVHLRSARVSGALDLGTEPDHAVLENTGGDGLTLDLSAAQLNELTLSAETICTSSSAWCDRSGKLALNDVSRSVVSTHSRWPHWSARHVYCA